MIHSVTPYVSTFVNKPPRFVTIWDSHWLKNGQFSMRTWQWNKIMTNFISIWDAYPCRFGMILKSDG